MFATTWKNDLRTLTLVLLAFLTVTLTTACGGGSDSAPEVQKAGAASSPIASISAVDVGLFSDEEGWQVAVSGLQFSDVASMSLGGVDLSSRIRTLQASGVGTLYSSNADFFFDGGGTSNALGLPLGGTLVITTTLGATFSFNLGFVDPTSVSRSFGIIDTTGGTATIQGVNWASVWRTARRMALNGVLSSVIKTYLRQNGYICPSLGPWWLCARPVS